MDRPEKYYGGFFWIAVISFIVPVFVAWFAFDKLRPATKPKPQPDASGVDHALFDYLLKQYVEDGLIDYEGFAKDYLFTTYLEQLAAAKPDALATINEKLALHCNAYNAFVIHGVIRHKIHRNEKNVLQWVPREIRKQTQPLREQLANIKDQPEVDIAAVQSLNEQIAELEELAPGFFDNEEHIFAGRTLSLDELEHSIIREEFDEPRIHVALVCAAKSCPAIRPEAYVGERLNEQLEDQARLFANNLKYVNFGESNNSVVLSPILNWYEEDFDDAGGILRWVAERVEDESLQQVLRGNPDLEFSEYDWTLNAQASTSSVRSSDPGVGSGSIRNE